MIGGNVYQRVDGDAVLVLRVEALGALIVLAALLYAWALIERFKNEQLAPIVVDRLAEAVKLGPARKLEPLVDVGSRSRSEASS